jgi:hypothetical protein
MTRLTVSSCLVVLAIISQAASAHVGGGQPFPIFELSTDELPDIHDGSLDDWEEVLPSFSLNQDQFAPLNVNDGAGIDTADLAYRVFMAWHSAGNHLYVAIERVDDVYVNTYEGGDLGNVWQHDSIEFMVDGDHTGGKYNRYLEEDGFGTEEAKLLSGFQAQQYFAIAVSPDNNTLGYGGAATWQSPHLFPTPAALPTIRNHPTPRLSKCSSPPGTSWTGAGRSAAGARN